MHGTGYRFRVAGDCMMCGAPPHRQLVLGRRLDRSQGWRPRRVRGKATTVVRCRRCGLVFTDPMPLPIELADHYSMDPVDYFGEERSSAESEGFETEIEEARAAVKQATYCYRSYNPTSMSMYAERYYWYAAARAHSNNLEPII